MTPGEVARIFGIDPSTVRAWGDKGKLEMIKTPGGHRRFYRDQVLDLYEDMRSAPKVFVSSGDGVIVPHGRSY